MTLRILAGPSCLVAALATLAAAPASAQRKSQLVSDVRTGFAGFAWGTTAEQIAVERGRPAADTMVRDYRRLVDHDTVDARPAEVWYLLHPERGLISGQLTLGKPEDGCEDAYKRVRQEVERGNPGLKKSEEVKRNLKLVCDKTAGAALGTWLLAWGDSGSARIQQMMLTGVPFIVLHYRGPAADAYAAEPRAARGPAMESFASFPWGTSRDSIIKKLGMPKLIDSTGGTVMLAYPDRLLGEAASVSFTVTPEEGLIKGAYLVLIPAGRDCDVFYRRFHFALIERYPDIKPLLIRQNSSRKPFCESLAAGTATLMVVWRDAESNASVTAEIKKPGKYVTITYLGSNYAPWLARTRGADVKNKL